MIQCEQYPKKFKSKIGLKTHVKNKHEKNIHYVPKYSKIILTSKGIAEQKIMITQKYTQKFLINLRLVIYALKLLLICISIKKRIIVIIIIMKRKN